MCDELQEAIAALRHKHHVGRQSRGNHGRIASPSNLIRIEGLLHFAADVNCGAGLGFLVQSKLCGTGIITTKLVWRLFAGLAMIIGTLYVLLALVLTIR